MIGYECKMWGQYLALVKAPGKVVEGMVYHVQTLDDRDKLAAYETSDYCTQPRVTR